MTGRAMLIAILTSACAGGVDGSRTVLSVQSLAHDAVAFVTESPSVAPPSQTLWVGFDSSRPQWIEDVGGTTRRQPHCLVPRWTRRVVRTTDQCRTPASSSGAPRRAGIGREPGTSTRRAVASATRITVDQDGRASVPTTDLRPDSPLWLPAAASGDVGFYSDGS